MAQFNQKKFLGHRFIMASLTNTSKEKNDEISSVLLDLTKAEIACCDMVTFMNVFAKLGTALRLLMVF